MILNVGKLQEMGNKSSITSLWSGVLNVAASKRFIYIYDYICIVSLSRETQEEVTRGLGAPPKSATKTRLR